jgi:hypothetical protein
MQLIWTGGYKEVNRTEPSLSARLPCQRWHFDDDKKSLSAEKKFFEVAIFGVKWYDGSWACVIKPYIAVIISAM